MTRTLLATTAFVFTAACATPDVAHTRYKPADFAKATAILQPAAPVRAAPVLAPLPVVQTVQRRRIVRAATTVPPIQQEPQETILAGARQARIEPTVDGYVNAIQVYPYTEGALYRLYASPGQVSDIALQPGETLMSVSAGDTVRWVVGDTVSGSGAAARAHILVKPVSADLTTNLMIATDRRTYHLELESVTSGYMAALSWRYPADAFVALTSRARPDLKADPVSIDTGLSLEGLDFDYHISGDTPDWTPVRVFDDGRQVYIQLPATIGGSDLPPLFVLGQNGDAELVNYRVRGNYYIVDQLFRAAELRLGTRRQTVVRIQKGQRRKGLAALFGR